MTYLYGHKSSEIEGLQRALAGLNLYKGRIDGEFWNQTLDAVKAAQELYRTNNRDGVVTKELLDHLGISPPPVPKPKSLNPIEEAALRLGLKLLFNKLFPGKDIDMDSVLTTVKSAWASKLNWTFAAHAVFNLLMFFGKPVPADVQEATITAGNSVFLVIEWVIRTWFTKSITTASAKAAGLK